MLHLQFFIWKVSNIDTVSQSFSCRLNLRASYEENAAKLKRPDESQQWSAACFAWRPQLRFFNLLEETSQREEWWRVTGSDFNKELPAANSAAFQDGSVWVHQNIRVSGVFEELFELRAFPLDLQHLHISVTSSWDVGCAVLRFSEMQRSSVSANASVSQLFCMASPRLIAYDSDWVPGRDLPLLSRAEESRTGARYPRAHIALVMTRHSTYYVWNILTMQVLIAVSNFSTFVIDPEDAAGRLSLIITLILASAAFSS